MSRNKEVSIRLIAKECNVSTATVSRVLNNPSKVSKGTREHVLEVLNKYQYTLSTPQKISFSFDTQSKIGVILSSSISFYYTDLQQNITAYFMERGIPTIIYSMEDQKNTLPCALQTLYSSDVSGIIFISCPYLPIADMIHPDIPCVWIDCSDPPSETEHILQVQTDHYVSGQLAAQELINKGCKKPLILTESLVTHRALDRNRGFQSILEKHNLAMDENQIIHLPFIKHHMIESRDIMQYLITKGEEFDSVFAINDWRSLGALIGIQNAGLRVPEDIRIIGFDGISIVCNMIENITSIQQNTELLARNACELLEKQIQGETITQKRIIVPPHLIMGQTT